MSYLDNELSVIRRECINFPGECSSVTLTTEDNDGELNIGHSPFVRVDQEFYLYMSQCSDLHDNMLDSAQANLMFIEDELSSPHVFSRRRLTYQCDVHRLSRGYQYTRIMVAFQERFGSFIDILRRIPDSGLLRITPGAGRYINGLAQAFTFHGYHAERLIPSLQKQNSDAQHGQGDMR